MGSKKRWTVFPPTMLFIYWSSFENSSLFVESSWSHGQNEYIIMKYWQNEDGADRNALRRFDSTVINGKWFVKRIVLICRVDTQIPLHISQNSYRKSGMKYFVREHSSSRFSSQRLYGWFAMKSVMSKITTYSHHTLQNLQQAICQA